MIIKNQPEPSDIYNYHAILTKEINAKQVSSDVFTRFVTFLVSDKYCHLRLMLYLLLVKTLHSLLLHIYQ